MKISTEIASTAKHVSLRISLKECKPKQIKSTD